jgi:hypothetical protein
MTAPGTTALALDDRDKYLTRPEAAKFLRKSVPTLERWHKLGTGPRSVLCGRLRLYPLVGLREFLGQEA